MKRTALITGISGQDGSYLAELLLEHGYSVHGVVRREALESVDRLWRINAIRDDITLYAASIESFPAMYRLVQEIKPDECYHLAAHSFVSYSFDDEVDVLNTNINSTYVLLAALDCHAPDCRFYFAGSSEMFGNAEESPQTEKTAFRPRSPYGVSKVAGYHIMRNYRDSLSRFYLCGILYNHESPRRGHEFVTQKIATTAARIKLGRGGKLRLGNLDARRDWGDARDYVRAIWLMLQMDAPEDYVIATGNTFCVKDIVAAAFEHLDLDYRDHIVIDDEYYRPSEKTLLTGDASKARRLLGWKPTRTIQDTLVEMVEAEVKLLGR